MPIPVKPIPDGYHAVTPYLFIDGAARALEFYRLVFAAEERMRLPGPNNTIGHAEICINGSIIMLADECPAMQARGPKSVGGSPVMIHVYVHDVDAVVNQALAAGAKLLQPVENKFYGDRSGSFVDPFGHLWSVATHVEEVSADEIQKRLAALPKK